MRLGFVGADHEVTGSCHYLEVCGKHILVDCGLEQGKDIYVNQDIPVPINQIDYVLLTHAHIDHSGRLPLLYKNGFHGDIISTFATSDLCSIMLRDSAHIQEFEAEWRNRKGKRAGLEEYVPLYTMADALGAIGLFHPCDYEQKIELCPGIHVRFRDVGHLLGSSSIEIWIEEDGVSKKIVFSGDIGNINQPLIKDPIPTDTADYVVMESTYGDRYHNAPPDYAAELASVINTTLKRGGNLVIPAFAVGRTQELLYFIRDIKERKLLDFDFPVYVDSPLAIEATSIFNKNFQSCFDDDAMALINAGISPIRFPNLHLAVSSDESKAINFNAEPKVIISASGMCEAGRIKHHLKHNLWRPECTVLIVGYQAYNTLGRSLIEGAEYCKLFGETIEIRAEIKQLQGISGHADKNGLLNWVKAFRSLLRCPVRPCHRRMDQGRSEDSSICRETCCQTQIRYVHKTYRSRQTAYAGHLPQRRRSQQGSRQIYQSDQFPLRQMGSLNEEKGEGISALSFLYYTGILSIDYESFSPS